MWQPPMVIILWQASAFVITYPVNNAFDKEGNETQRAVAWEKAFIQLAKVCSWYIFPFNGCFLCSFFFFLFCFTSYVLLWSTGFLISFDKQFNLNNSVEGRNLCTEEVLTRSWKRTQEFIKSTREANWELLWAAIATMKRFEHNHKSNIIIMLLSNAPH